MSQVAEKNHATEMKQMILDELVKLRVKILSDVNDLHDRSLSHFQQATSTTQYDAPSITPTLLVQEATTSVRCYPSSSSGPSQKVETTDRREVSSELKAAILDELNGLYERSFNYFESFTQIIDALEVSAQTEQDLQLPCSCATAVGADEADDTAVGSGKEEPCRRDVQEMVDKLRATCEEWEQIHLDGVVIPERIGTAFSNVQLPQSTIETVRRLVMLPLSRPDAFSYGVLKNNKINGVLFYGPPGTGKTHLARAVATESGATMLEVSGAQLFQKWVGESEKAIRGMFSLAAKLKPCFIFIDEADNIFRNRKEEDSNYRREMLNQLLSEWDGVNTSNMLVMAATNRPWELDKAVLRRLPTRILVDMPTIEDRQAIFRIYLKNEQLDDDVDIADLARRSQSCTGSDIKNLCVSAALACVWEEEEKQIQQQRDMPPKLREKLRYTQNREVVPRVLYMRHFETAMMEVMASTDTALMTQIRDFSKAYGGDMMASQGNHKQRQQFKMMFMETPQGAHVPDENLAKHEEESKKKKQWPQVETFTHIEEVEPTRLPTSLDTA